MLILFLLILTPSSQLEGVISEIIVIRHDMRITAEVSETKILANERVECPCIVCTFNGHKHCLRVLLHFLVLLRACWLSRVTAIKASVCNRGRFCLYMVSHSQGLSSLVINGCGAKNKAANCQLPGRVPRFLAQPEALAGTDLEGKAAWRLQPSWRARWQWCRVLAALQPSLGPCTAARGEGVVPADQLPAREAVWDPAWEEMQKVAVWLYFGHLWVSKPRFVTLRASFAAEACSTTEDGDEPLHCPTGYECHIINPGNTAEGIPNRGQCIKLRGNPGQFTGDHPSFLVLSCKHQEGTGRSRWLWRRSGGAPVPVGFLGFLGSPRPTLCDGPHPAALSGL